MEREAGLVERCINEIINEKLPNMEREKTKCRKGRESRIDTNRRDSQHSMVIKLPLIKHTHKKILKCSCKKNITYRNKNVEKSNGRRGVIPTPTKLYYRKLEQ